MLQIRGTVSLGKLRQKNILYYGMQQRSNSHNEITMVIPFLSLHSDTVNIASRHETTGEVGRVHCSQTTMLELLECTDQFRMKERGKGEWYIGGTSRHISFPHLSLTFCFVTLSGHERKRYYDDLLAISI